MSKNKKQSLEDALLTISSGNVASVAPKTKIVVEQDIPIIKTEVKKAENKPTKKLIIEINEESYYQLHQLRLDLKRSSVKELVSEALNDLFKKYNKPPIV